MIAAVAVAPAWYGPRLSGGFREEDPATTTLLSCIMVRVAVRAAWAKAAMTGGLGSVVLRPWTGRQRRRGIGHGSGDGLRRCLGGNWFGSRHAPRAYRPVPAGDCRVEVRSWADGSLARTRVVIDLCWV